ncbi:hypothetical protein OIU79_009073 [Salix purpurea]|uniref:Uncharacterized protein n=1 Tax=Salix purpurea TaxID=77065 RepID=A0A9Q0YX06_SALPP|nr:hypothetical protein OIU79_009073 [Salix purpurea]
MPHLKLHVFMPLKEINFLKKFFFPEEQPYPLCHKHHHLRRMLHEH